MKELEAINEIAHCILQNKPGPVVRFRILRDILKTSHDTSILTKAKQEMSKNRWIMELKSEQREDGSWGRFHSAIKTKGKIVTTEAAVERGLALGLDASDPAFRAE